MLAFFIFIGYTVINKPKGYSKMNENNICKFIPEALAFEREIFNFVYEKKHAAMKKHVTLAASKLCLVSRGEPTFYCDGMPTKCSAGSIIFIFEGEESYVEPDDKTEYLYITFRGTRYDELFRRFSVNRSNRCFSGFDGLIPMWSESLSRAIDDNIDLVAESMLIYTLSRLTGVSGSEKDLIEQVVRLSEQNYMDPELSLATVSAEVRYNPKYVSHLFKKRMGMGYTEYLRMLRLKNAIALFDHGLDSVKNVALLSGFSDPLYFSSVFKGSVGKSPKEYIMSRRGGGNEPDEAADDSRSK